MLSLLLLLAPQAPAPTQDASALREQDLRAHVGYLASDALEGRGSGMPGARLAAEYVVAHWRRLGLQPANDGSYYHEFALRGSDGSEQTGFNTCAILPGTDPEVADQYLVIGAHHDHAGLGDPIRGAMGFPGEVHNGADDNASGTSGVMELAEYFRARPLRHPILFVTFDAEERGLLGSEAIVADGVVPPEQMLFMLNLDMIGRMRDGYVFVGGMGTAEELDELLDPVFGAATADGFNFEFHPGGEAPSDNTNFYRAGVPSFFFFTHIHEAYHLPEDDADKINYAGQLEILKLAVEVLSRVDRVDALTYVQQSGAEAQGMPADFMPRMTEHFRRIGERREKQGRLGVTIGDAVDTGVAIDAVREDSAAAAAGVLPGDVLLGIDRRRVTDRDTLRRALAGRWKGETLTLRLLRDGERIELEATLQ